MLIQEHPHDAPWLRPVEKERLLLALGPPRQAAEHSLCAATRATVRTTTCRMCAAQYVISSMLTNAARFFLPTLLSEVYPGAHEGALRSSSEPMSPYDP